MKNEEAKNNFKEVLKSYFRKEEAFLLPNILCYFRIILIFVFMALYLTDFTLANNTYANVYFAAAVMIIAAYTDFVDGYIARTFDMKSNLGKALDPIADKLLQAAIAISLCIKLIPHSFYSVIAMFVIFALKESTLICQDIALARNKLSFGGAKLYGKISTFIFYIILGTLLVASPTIIKHLDENNNFHYAHIFIDTLCTIAIFFLSLSWILYSIDVHKLLKQSKIRKLENKKEDNYK